MNKRTLTTILSCLLVSGASVARAQQQWPQDPAITPPPPPPAPTPPPTLIAPTGERFGDPGQMVITNDFALSLAYSRTSQPNQNETRSKLSQTSLALSPALTFFVARNLGVGGFVELSYETHDRTEVAGTKGSSTILRLGPEVNYNLQLAPALSLFPRVSLAYSFASGTEEENVGDVKVSGTGLSVAVFAPVLFHVGRNFFVGIGPYVSFDLTSSVEEKVSDMTTYDGDGAKTTSFGLRFLVGGWL